jgi:hypothetical protein
LNIEFSIPTLIELTDLEENAKLCNSNGLIISANLLKKKC